MKKEKFSCSLHYDLSFQYNLSSDIKNLAVIWNLSKYHSKFPGYLFNCKCIYYIDKFINDNNIFVKKSKAIFQKYSVQSCWKVIKILQSWKIHIKIKVAVCAEQQQVKLHFCVLITLGWDNTDCNHS